MSEEAMLKQIRIIVREETILIVREEVAKVVKEEVSKLLNAAVARLEARMDAGDNALLVLIKGVDDRVTKLAVRVNILEEKFDSFKKEFDKSFNLLTMRRQGFSDFKDNILFRMQNVENLVSAKLKECPCHKYDDDKPLDSSDEQSQGPKNKKA